jgi:Flp pilus assembly protein TadG
MALGIDREGTGHRSRSDDRQAGDRHTDAGHVIVEIAFAIPALLMIIIALMWMTTLGLSHSRAADLAQQAARSLARGGDSQVVHDTVQRILPGAHLGVAASDNHVDVTVTQEVSAPVPLLRGFSITVHGKATALREPGSPL